jgi:hypothetical protein
MNFFSSFEDWSLGGLFLMLSKGYYEVLTRPKSKVGCEVGPHHPASEWKPLFKSAKPTGLFSALLKACFRKKDHVLA